MDKKQESEFISDKLLQRYCEGKVSDEEYRLVTEWIHESEENYRHLQQIHLLRLAADTIYIRKRIDTEKALDQVNSRIPKRIEWKKYMMQTAAILFIPLLFLYGVQFLRKEEPEAEQILQVKTNPGMTTRLVLPDGSRVHLNSESTLEYPVSFTGKERIVMLEGEAFFEVMASEEKPFRVITPFHAEVEVTGTKFNIEAYRNNPVISVTLTEGLINFLFKENAQYKKLSMLPGYKAIYDSSLAQMTLSKTTGKSETAWTDGKIVFENTSFDEALRILEKRFHLEFVVKSDRFKGDSFSGEFTTQRLERILEYFKLSSNIYWRYLETNHEAEEKTKIEIY